MRTIEIIGVTLRLSETKFRSNNMDRLVSMAVFKQTVDAGSFAAAARYLGISPEMAGNHVRGLETHLGVRLLNRSTRRLNLTEAGGIYYERCARILADIQDAEAEVGVCKHLRAACFVSPPR